MSAIACLDADRSKSIRAKNVQFYCGMKGRDYFCPNPLCKAKMKYVERGDQKYFSAPYAGAKHAQTCVYGLAGFENDQDLREYGNIKPLNLLETFINGSQKTDASGNRDNGNVSGVKNEGAARINSLDRMYKVCKQNAPSTYIGPFPVRELLLDNRSIDQSCPKFDHPFMAECVLAESPVYNSENMVINCKVIGVRTCMRITLKFEDRELFAKMKGKLFRTLVAPGGKKESKLLRNSILVVAGNWEKEEGEKHIFTTVYRRSQIKIY